MKENIGKYALITECVTAGVQGLIGKIEDVHDFNGKSDCPRFKIKLPENQALKTEYVHIPVFNVEIIDKMYTKNEALNLRTDLDVLRLPRRIWCDSEETLDIIAGKLQECHLGYSINITKLFIQT